MANEEPADQGGIFGRPASTLPESDGLAAAVRRAIAFQRTMTAGTVLRGGLLFLGSALYLPLPLLLGYLLNVGRWVGSGEPAPDFGDWQRQYLRGLGLVVVQTALSMAILVLVAVVAVIGNLGDSATAGVWVLAWGYATPWSIAVYGHGSWRAFLDRRTWRWLVSPQYLVTVLVAAVVFAVGYVVVALSVITLVGWLFVGFLLFAVLAALVGQRYHDYATARDAAGTATADAGVGSVAETLRNAVSAASSAVERDRSDSETTAATAGSEADDEDNAADDPVETEYTRFRERARHVESEEGLERLEAGDGGRVQFVSLTAESEAAVAAFERAVGRWEGISGSDAVTTVYDTGDDPSPWVAYDPLDGSLREMGELSPAAVVAVTGAVADAMTTGRRYNIAHGAVRPDCVFVERSGGAGPAADRIEATVGDWELQRELAAVTDAVTLPAHYCAPEQFGDGPTDERADVYQLAATAHYALFGEPPFRDVGTATLADPDRSVTWDAPGGWHVSDEAVAVFERALATDPGDRHDSPGELHRALRRALPAES